ncbi:hypothetical protein JCM11251_000123 [Rhodosporidiobolus azoricus]
MGNLPSRSLSLSTLKTLRPPRSPTQLTKADLSDALDLIWIAYLEQNPSREDKPVFQRQKGVLLEVIWGQWHILHMSWQLGLWNEWRMFLSLDLLDPIFTSTHLRKTAKLYFQSVETADELLCLIADFNLKPVFRWANATQTWLWYAWEAGRDPELRREAIDELQSVVNGLAREKDEEEKGGAGYLFGDLSGHEEMFKNPHYDDFPALASLLHNYQEKERRAGNAPEPVIFDGGDHLAHLTDPKREWRLDRQERECLEGDGRRRTRSSSPRRSPSPHARSAQSFRDGEDDDLATAFERVRLGTTPSQVRSGPRLVSSGLPAHY